mmetsp:Transcript_4216/g.5242  ORF Transcript_4216/g.5242 Transcript_4216/m.5242 type:complete len:267 (+) Transcript_4216:45-845(+)
MKGAAVIPLFYLRPVLNKNSVFSAVGGREDTVDDVLDLRDSLALDGPGVGHGDLGAGDSLHGRVQVVEGLGLHQNAGDLRANAALRPAFFHVHDSVRLLDGLDDGVSIEGAQGAQVDDLAADAVISLQDLGSLQGVAHHLRVRCNGHIRANSLDFGLANRDDELFVHDFGVDIELDAVHHLVLEENDGVIVADGGLEQAAAVLDVPGAHDFEAWDRRVPGGEALRVLGSDTRADSVNSAEDNRARQVTSRHVERLRSRVDDVVDGL